MEDQSRGLAVIMASVGLLAVVYGFFVLVSHAIVRSRSRRLEELEQSGRVGSTRARSILERTDYYLLAAQIGSYLSAMALMVGFVLFMYRTDLWDAAELLSGRGVADKIVGLGLTILALLVVILIYVQILKAVAYTNPTRVLCYLSFPLVVVARIFDPLVCVLNGILRRLLNAAGLALPQERDVVISSEDISEIVEESSEAGKIEENEGDMIQGVIQFSDLVVREVMTPRKDVIHIGEDASLDELITVFTSEGFSRILVIGSSLDDVKGVLMAKDLIPWVGKEAPAPGWRAMIREPYTVPNTKKVGELLQEFKRTAIHFAVVLDEHGGVDGVVTIEDLVEEIVGDIFDEYDTPEDEMSCRKTLGGDLIVDGRAVIDELNEAHGFDFPAGEYDTIAGFVINLIGRIPAAGEVFDYDGLKIKVERVSQNRIVRLRVVRETAQAV